MADQTGNSNRQEIRDPQGRLLGHKTQLGNVSLVAVQESEFHRTLEADRTVTEVELPGTVNLYAVIDGGWNLLDRLNASKVQEAAALAAQNQQQTTDTGQQSQTTEPPADSGPQSQTVNEPQG